MHLWRGEYGPFIRYAQMDFCRRLIVVPLTTFHRLAEEIGDPQGELIFLFNTTRCGSTLLTQVSQRIDVMYLTMTTTIGTVWFYRAMHRKSSVPPSVSVRP